MKTMTCLQLGGACSKKFNADTFEQIAALSKTHAKEMLEKEDPAHLKAMQKMQHLMQSPEAMQQWFEAKRNEFETLPNI